MLPHELPKGNDGVFEQNARQEDADKTEDRSNNTALVGVDHSYCAEEARKVEVGSRERLDQGKTHQELLIGHPVRIHGVCFQQRNDHRSAAKDDGARKVKGGGQLAILSGHLTVLIGSTRRNQGFDQNGCNEDGEKDQEEKEAKFLCVRELLSFVIDLKKKKKKKSNSDATWCVSG